jgi:CheY-like chemotaxis protein
MSCQQPLWKTAMKTSQINVVIVEPDADARECLRDLLEAEGYAAMSAPPGQEALHLLRQSPVPCVVLLNKIGTAQTSLQHLAVLEHEEGMLMIALDVLAESTCDGVVVERTANDPAPACACLVDHRLVNRQAFQQALRARLRQLHPIRDLVKTSAERVERFGQRSC